LVRRRCAAPGKPRFSRGIDSTATKVLMHEPSDSSLLLDAVRVMTPSLEQACALAGTRPDQRARLYQHSLARSRRPSCIASCSRPPVPRQSALERALVLLAVCGEPAAAGWYGEVRRYLRLIESVMTRTRRWVLNGEMGRPASRALSPKRR
jgi:hypothetical protein